MLTFRRGLVQDAVSFMKDLALHAVDLSARPGATTQAFHPWELYCNDGKQHGNYYSILGMYRDKEKKTETTISVSLFPVRLKRFGRLYMRNTKQAMCLRLHVHQCCVQPIGEARSNNEKSAVPSTGLLGIVGLQIPGFKVWKVMM